MKNEDNSEKKITLCENEDNSRLRRVGMPSGMAAQVRELLASSDKTGLVLERAPPGSRSSTGFVNVIKVKDWFQARLQVKGDGREGEKKRTQVPLPGLFIQDGGGSGAAAGAHQEDGPGDSLVRRGAAEAEQEAQEAQHSNSLLHSSPARTP